MQITKNALKQACAAVLIFLGVVGGWVSHNFDSADGFPNDQILKRVLLGSAPFILTGAWLLFESPIITVPCATFVSMQALWRLWESVYRPMPGESLTFSVVVGMIFSIPVAIELRHFIASRRKVDGDAGPVSPESPGEKLLQ